MLRLIRRYPLMTFFVLAFGITWAVWVPRAAGTSLGAVGQAWTWAPALAALLAATLTGGRGGGSLGAPGSLARELAMVPGGHLGPACFSLAVVGVYAMLGGSWAAAAPPALRGETSFASVLLFLTVLALTDGLGEEPARRGFALPRLLSRHDALAASAILGVPWALWHLPLVWTEGAPLYHQPAWLLLVDVTAKSVLFAWVFLHTRGSVLIAVLLHASTNLFVVSPAVAEVGGLALPLLAAGAKWALVGAVVTVAGPGLARGPRPEALPRTL